MYSEYEFFSTSHQMKKMVERACESLMENYGLRKIELDILYFVAHAGSHDTAKDITHTRHISKAHISKSVDNLRRRGYIDLLEDEGDHRCFHIHITKEGEPVIREFEQIRRQVYKTMFAGITEEEKRCMQNVFRKIASNIDAEQKKEKEEQNDESIW